MQLKRLIPLFALLMANTAAHAQERKPRSSWTSDRHDFAEGDIITVLVDEATLASARKNQYGSDNQQRNNSIGVSMPGGMTVGLDANVGTSKRASSDQQGSATRDLRFRGEMTVRVVKVNDKTGVLEVKGARTVDVDKNKQQLELRGFIRPEDVSRANTIESARVADAQVLYTLSGDIGGTRGGIIGRLVSVFWP